MGKSIRQKVSLFIAIIVFLAIFISMATVYTIVKSDQIDLEKQCLQSETSRYAEKINVWMSEEMALVKDVAKSIEALDELTEEKIKAVLISNFTGRTELLDLYFGTENIAFTFDEISKDTVEQANDANRIIDEIERITSVIESNTATAQEIAASTEELSTQSNKLTSLISQFRI